MILDLSNFSQFSFLHYESPLDHILFLGLCNIGICKNTLNKQKSGNLMKHKKNLEVLEYLINNF